MIRFKQYITEAKTAHMRHVEELILDGGVSGAVEALNFLRSLRDMLAGHATKAVNVTVKWDGAPAIFAGYDPSDGKFFVARKGIFNKNPKVFKTNAEIDADDAPADLTAKMKLALAEFPKLGIKGVVQGDFLYAKEDLKIIDIDGEPHVTFHPNTIVYAVPAKSATGKAILGSKVGVVWHTTYRGSSFESMSPSFGEEIASGFKKVGSVWAVDAVYKDVSGTATFTADETKEVIAILSRAGKLLQGLKRETFTKVAETPALLNQLKIYLNAKVREGHDVPTADIAAAMDKFYKDDIETKKSEKGKAEAAAKHADFVAFYKSQQAKDLFAYYAAIVEAKKLIIKKLDKAGGLKTLLKTGNGFEVTGNEGFVAIDHTGSKAVKLVDRLQFTRANWSPDVIKGWVR